MGTKGQGLSFVRFIRYSRIKHLYLGGNREWFDSLIGGGTGKHELDINMGDETGD